jgi:hypothetical protein
MSLHTDSRATYNHRKMAFPRITSQCYSAKTKKFVRKKLLRLLQRIPPERVNENQGRNSLLPHFRRVLPSATMATAAATATAIRAEVTALAVMPAVLLCLCSFVAMPLARRPMLTGLG